MDIESEIRSRIEEIQTLETPIARMLEIEFMLIPLLIAYSKDKLSIDFDSIIKDNEHE